MIIKPTNKDLDTNKNLKPITVGFEIEGEWDSDYTDYKGPNGTEQGTCYEELKSNFGGIMKSDGSIRHCEETDNYSDDLYCLSFECLEYNSKVFKIDDRKEIDSLFDFLENLYQDNRFCFNKSCGFHIHLGFKTKPNIFYYYSFNKILLKKIEELFPEEYKQRVNNQYCKLHNSDNSIFIRDRYRAVNYCSWLSHKTLEIRFFPTNQPLKMKKYLYFIIDFFNQFIDSDWKDTKSKRLGKNTIKTKIDVSNKSKSTLIVPVEHYNAAKIDNYPNKEYGTISTCWDRIDKVKEFSNFKINILSNSVDFLQIDKDIKDIYRSNIQHDMSITLDLSSHFLMNIMTIDRFYNYYFIRH